MEEKHAIEVSDLVISYQNLKKTSIKKNLLHLKRQKADRFVAVKGISFYVREGEILGIIGKNGSGKSTTLNALAGIFSPDSGTIDLKGHSISLLSIGVGFQREMTGRENITLSGMLLGFSEHQVKEKALIMPAMISVKKSRKSLILPNLGNLLTCRSEPIPVVCIPNWHFPLLQFWKQTSCLLMKY